MLYLSLTHTPIDLDIYTQISLLGSSCTVYTLKQYIMFNHFLLIKMYLQKWAF